MVKAYLSIATREATPVQLTILIEKLRKMEGVVLADSVSGEFNAIAVVNAPDVDALNRMVTDLKDNNPIIERIVTSISETQTPAVGG